MKTIIKKMQFFQMSLSQNEIAIAQLLH